jgi:hypothetical protein
MQILREGVRASFESVDILVRPSVDKIDSLEARWAVSVRGTPPDLGTWWREWLERNVRMSEIPARIEAIRERASQLLTDRPG